MIWEGRSGDIRPFAHLGAALGGRWWIDVGWVGLIWGVGGLFGVLVGCSGCWWVVRGAGGLFHGWEGVSFPPSAGGVGKEVRFWGVIGWKRANHLAYAAYQLTPHFRAC
jgi:hypothetical protein